MVAAERLAWARSVRKSATAWPNRNPGTGSRIAATVASRCLIVLGSCDNSKPAGLAAGAAALVTAEPHPSLLR